MKPRFLLFIIILLTLLSAIINIPNLSPDLKFRKGLDLEGGTSITFKANMSEIPGSSRDSALESAREVIEQRINIFGVSEPVIQTARTEGDYRIIVELAGVSDLTRAREIIGDTAQLTFWEQKSDEISTTSAYLSNFKETDLAGEDLKITSVVFDPNTGQPQVQLQFTEEGARKFAKITQRNTNKIVAIVLDETVISSPVVNEPILTGDAVIQGNFTTESAKDLSVKLNGGALPVPLETLQSQVIGPTLGVESLQKSLFAGIVGLIIIVFFMTASYGKLGVLASAALLLYTLLVLAIFKLSSLTPYGITLTLSGIAGFILSIGMAVDANILIFERMKEELRAGKGKELATELGFQRAWTSIRDSNFSTIITSVILIMFGTGIVKGFAIVLIVGVLVSMFSAIVVTRTLIRLTFK